MAELGVIASIIGLISTGAKLSLVLFDFASSIGNAGRELQDVGSEISLFCAVVKQLQAVLSHANFRYSSNAIATTKQIIDRCQQIFDEISIIVTGLQTGQRPALVPTVDFVARVKWTFKKSQVQVLRSTLDSCKLTLHVMLTTMEFAQRVSTRRISTRLTQEEDERDNQMTQSLIISQQCSISHLELLEEETEREESKASRTVGVKDPGQLKKLDKKLERLSGLLGTLSVNTSTVELPAQPPRRQQRASIWLSNILSGDEAPIDPHPGTRVRRLSSAQAMDKPMELLRKWTDQADHAQFHQGSLAMTDPGSLWNHGNFSFSAPDLNAIDEIVEEHGPKPGVERVQTDLLSPGSSARASSVAWPLPVALATDHTQVDTELEYIDVLTALQNEYDIDVSSNRVDLYLAYGGHTRKIDRIEKPLAVAKQYSEMALKPVLFLQKAELHVSTES